MFGLITAVADVRVSTVVAYGMRAMSREKESICKQINEYLAQHDRKNLSSAKEINRGACNQYRSKIKGREISKSQLEMNQMTDRAQAVFALPVLPVPFILQSRNSHEKCTTQTKHSAKKRTKLVTKMFPNESSGTKNGDSQVGVRLTTTRPALVHSSLRNSRHEQIGFVIYGRRDIRSAIGRCEGPTGTGAHRSSLCETSGGGSSQHHDLFVGFKLPHSLGSGDLLIFLFGPKVTTFDKRSMKKRTLPNN
jgi:hypothetical protein